MSKIFRIGLLGASRIAPTAVIGPARAGNGFEISTVASRDRDRAGAYAREHRIPAVADDYGALVARDDVDLVYNALPPAGHARWTIAALEAGKAVLCEKPFAMNAEEARAMVETARREKLILIEAFHYRFHAVIRQAEAIVRAGTLGVLRRASAQFAATIPRTPNELRWRAEMGGGAMMDLGCYPLHALRTLIGAEPHIEGAVAVFEHGVDAEMKAQLRFVGDVEAELTCAMNVKTPAARLILEGDNGLLSIHNYMAPQIGCRFSTTIGGVTETLPTEGPTTYTAQLAHVYDVLTGRAAPLTGGDDAIANMTAIDAIYRAAGRVSPVGHPSEVTWK